jgi:hypothetical protein
MFRSLRNLLGGRPAARPRSRQSVRPGLDALEGRQLLTLYGASLVAGNPSDYDYGVSHRSSANASAPGGAMVAAWITSAGDGDTIYARTYGPTKVPNANVVQARFNSGYHQYDSVRAAINDSGYFAVAWRDYNPFDNISSVYVSRFDPSSHLLATDQVVGDYGGGDVSMPDVAVDANGNVGVSFVNDFAGNEYVEVQWFCPVGGTWWTHVDFTGGAAFANTRISMSPDGYFVVGYDRTEPDWGGYWGLELGGYRSWGFEQDFSGTYAAQPDIPFDFAISTNDRDQVAVAYVGAPGDGTSTLWATRIDSSGNVYNSVMVDNTGGAISGPSIAFTDFGEFVVAYNTSSVLGYPWSSGVDLAEVTGGDTITRHGIYGPDPDETSDPAVSIDANGNYFVTFTYAPPGESGQIWSEMGQLTPPISLLLPPVHQRTTMYKF